VSGEQLAVSSERREWAMQVVTIILFTALILGFFFLFLLPG
jgi:hypothetical protein